MRDKIYPDLERFPDIWGLFGGTFDDPNWFDRSAANCRHIFTGSAQHGVVLPRGVDTFEAHATKLDGTPNSPTVLAHHVAVFQASAERGSTRLGRVIKSSQPRVIFGSRPRATARVPAAADRDTLDGGR
jgi:hypothetical protein